MSSMTDEAWVRRSGVRTRAFKFIKATMEAHYRLTGRWDSPIERVAEARGITDLDNHSEEAWCASEEYRSIVAQAARHLRRLRRSTWREA